MPTVNQERRETQLKVGELTERGDFGRGIVRISSKDMKKLGITEGDIVEMEGKRKTVAVAIRAYPVDVGLDVIRMDGLERRNCGAGIGDVVKIRNADVKEAKSVTLAPARKGLIIHMGNNIIKQNLLMRPFMTGDIIIPNPIINDRRNQTTLFEQFFGVDFGEMFFTPFGEEKFIVVSTDPKGAVRITRATDVELLPQSTKSLEEEKIPEVTYEDLGGLHEEIKKVREMIELPLKHPELFERLGIEPPKGILLHGPPGCLTGEALVAIEDGRLVRIGELGKNLVPGIYVADLPVYPPAHAKAIHVYDVPETVEIISKSGRRLRMTPNHPLMTDKGWVEAEKLMVGDKVKVFNWIPNPRNYVPTNFILNEKRLVNEIKVPNVWDEKLAELVGIFVAEGTIDPRRIKFTIHRDENDLREKIISLMKEIFDADFTERVGITRAVRRIRVANRGVWDFFKILWKKEKSIPQEILLSPNSVAAAFLRGLFDGDGSVVKKNRHFDRAVTLKSKSRQLLEEVQILLLRWSIRSSIYSYKDLYGEYHTLKIRGRDNLRKYRNDIGFISKPKIRKLEEQLSTYVRRTPNEDTDFEPIREVRRVNGWERVYDFEVPTTHSFFSNGILSHNTGKTLLAKAVANESGAKFLVMNGPECMSKFYRESLTPDENIFTIENGMASVNEIGEVVKSKSADSVAEFDDSGMIEKGKIKSFIEHPFQEGKKIFEITTSTGRKIKVTDYHSLFALKDGKISDIKTSDINPNDTYLAIPLRLPAPEIYDTINIPKELADSEDLNVRSPQIKDFIKKIGIKKASEILNIKEKYAYDIYGKNVCISIKDFLRLSEESNIHVDHKNVEIVAKQNAGKLPSRIEIDEDMATVIGLFLAEGSYTTKDAIRITNELPESKEIVRRFCKKYGIHLTEYEDDMLLNSKPLKVIFEKVLGIKTGAENKEITSKLMSMPLNLINAMLRGYFTGDGSVYPPKMAHTIEGSTHSKKLANSLMYTLLYFGIVAKCNVSREKYNGKLKYRILIQSPEGFKKFSEIGFLDAKRNERIQNYLKSKKFDKTQKIPIWPELRELIKSNQRLYAWSNSKTIGKDILKKELIKIDPKKNMHKDIWNIIGSELAWDKVVEMKEIEYSGNVYDVSVNPNENFVAGFGGIFAHNSEENLRKLFDQAEKNAPSIVFIDEIDAIAPKREEVKGEVEKRVVSQLLTLLDGLKSRGKVIVIGATNLPNSLDPALRRPGRFDREIELGVPNKDGRKEILQIHTRGMPLTSDVNLDKISEITYGYVGADLLALCKESAMHALRRVLPDLGEIKEDKPIDENILKRLIVTKEDFDHAMKIVEPSAMREVLVEIPKVKWEDIGGLEEVKNTMKEVVEWPLKHPDAFKRLGIRPPTGVLLYGPPGCGKTLIAKAVANESGANFISVKGPELLSMYVGESERHIRDVFRRAKQVAPSIIFFDEIDALVPRRSYSNDSHVSERVVSQLLVEISGLEELNDVVVVAATNRPDIVDPALLRPGRFDRQVLVSTPDDKTRLEILKVHTGKMPISEDVSIERMSRETVGFSGADLEALVREAAILAMRKNINTDQVTSKDFAGAMKEVKPSVSDDMNKFYESILKRRKSRALEEEVTYTG